jgi:hypothetical protein
MTGVRHRNCEGCQSAHSGTGVKIFALGAPTEITGSKVLKIAGERVAGKRPQIEAYVEKRYFTVTGDKIPDAPDEIRSVPEAWARLIECLNETKRLRSSKAEEGRNGALFALGCRLQAHSKSDDEIPRSFTMQTCKGTSTCTRNLRKER